jgi:tRNA-2-methylthio-N6-dimethylallyladenosine synthase
VKSERLARLQERLEAHRQAFNHGTVGRTLDVLLEKAGRHPGQLAGKTPYLQMVQIDGAGRNVGDIVPVRISAAGSNSLFGEAPAADGSWTEASAA